ncbi:hypothetical protein [Gordonia zhaorongruii]|uniref:hypothetical protein n=1 Tax=Gordonia zhaorongruii TaxID=2597659 RepID=UPI00104C61A0|nr:hypothetical protein [Gordonia zhaorongruii]
MIGRAERSKDVVQTGVESTAAHVGNIASIITTAIADVAREIGELVTDGFEMREASKLAERAQDGSQAAVANPELNVDARAKSAEES